jgi:hypothetical protein
MKYRVTSRRLVGTAEGDIISGEGLEALGIDPLHAALSGHVVAVEYTEPKKYKSARKDASDTEKD